MDIRYFCMKILDSYTGKHPIHKFLLYGKGNSDFCVYISLQSRAEWNVIQWKCYFIGTIICFLNKNCMNPFIGGQILSCKFLCFILFSPSFKSTPVLFDAKKRQNWKENEIFVCILDPYVWSTTERNALRHKCYSMEYIFFLLHEYAYWRTNFKLKISFLYFICF